MHNYLKLIQLFLISIFLVLVFSITVYSNTIDIDFNSGIDSDGNSQGVLHYTGVDGFEVWFTDDNSNGTFGGDADGVHITNINYGNIKVGSSTDFVLGAYNNFNGGNNYHSSGIVANFNQGATSLSFDDTDDDGTLKALFAYDQHGNLIAQSAHASQIPIVVNAPLTGSFAGHLIYSVEFDTLAGTAGGSFDGTYFTIDNFHAEGVDSSTQIDINTVPEPTTMLLFGIGILGFAGVNRKKEY